MIKEAIILAGGFGTRLKKLVDELPKTMAPVNDIPFLTYILEHLLKFKVEKVILAVGYRYEDIISYFGNYYKDAKIEYSIEKEPLGTGGAIFKGIQAITSQYCYVLNGDTYYNVDLIAFEKSFSKSRSVLSIALKPMVNFDRYGSVTTKRGKIKSFNEKKFCENGLINGGVYIVDKRWLDKNAPGRVFSFEKDILEQYVSKDIIAYFLSDTYFIDIGIPEDYLKASQDLPALFN
jgi:D-glycero-alpha-D-manno-heptose 1-phosphate guanylyltransferase